MDETKFIELLKRIDKELEIFNYGLNCFIILKECKELTRDVDYICGCLYSVLDIYETKCIMRTFKQVDTDEIYRAKDWLLDFAYDSRS